MKQKINVRLFIISLLAILATTLGITFIYYNIFQNQVKKDLVVNAQLIADSHILDDESGELDESSFKNLANESLRVTWIDADGTVLYDNDTDPKQMENHMNRPEVKEAFETGSGSSIRKSDTMNMNTFYYALKLENGTVVRVATLARSLINVFLTSIPLLCLIIGFIVLICVWIGHVLTGQLLAPIESMAEHLDDVVSTPVYRELEPFADKIRAQHENILDAAKIRQDFTANVTHELKTPLTAIIGYAELIENKMVEGEQNIYMASQIRKNAVRLLSLINDIIKLSELDHKEMPRNFENVKLLAVAKEVTDTLKMNAEMKNISLTCDGSNFTILADRDLIKEVIVNLVQNAIQYNNPGGYVDVKVYQTPEHKILEVEDNGIGIPKNKQEHVFERFYRVDKSRSRETGGTGLGLAIVKHAAEIHDAKIELQSEEGKGTTIRIIF